MLFRSQGTLVRLNAALAGLKFTPTTGFAGSASIGTTYEDLAIAQTTTATTAVSVVVPASKPTIKIEAPKLGTLGKAVAFEILATDTNATARTAAYQFSISFGDGTPIKTVTSKSPLVFTHVFARAGTYTVAAIARDEYGHTSAVVSVTIRIVSLLPAALSSATAPAWTSGTAAGDGANAATTFAFAVNFQGDFADELIPWTAVSAALEFLSE